MLTARRTCIVLAVALVTSPRAWAQAAPPLVALVMTDTPVANMQGEEPKSSYAKAFIGRLRDLGYVEGRNIRILRRSAEGRPERLPELMRELVEMRVDLIATGGTGGLIASRATKTIPIVTFTDDPVGVGLLESLARPGRNLTGVSGTAGSAVEGKLLQLLKQAVPSLAKVAVLDYPVKERTTGSARFVRRNAIEAAARDARVSVVSIGIEQVQELDRALETILREGADAVLVMPIAVNQVNRKRIIDFAAQKRLPTIYGFSEATAEGGLMSYASTGGDYVSWQRMADYVDKILKGANPAELPYLQPTAFDLVINLKTARALGLDLPRSLMLQASTLIN
jgi:putative ABC transport system substrate-binding protein